MLRCICNEWVVLCVRLGATATLGAGAGAGADADDEDDAAAWVQRSRDIDRQKKDAAKRVSIYFILCFYSPLTRNRDYALGAPCGFIIAVRNSR